MTPAEAPVGRLVVVPTPIGNLEDITLRALGELARADVIACEDTRRTGVLLARHGIAGARLESYHEHNEGLRARELLARVRGGAVVALVSDAGTPLVSDPGYELVGGCLREGLPVEVLPGASAILVALAASGLPCASFRFVGFLPRARGELARLLAEAAETVVAFESPRRLAATLAVLAEIDPSRPAAVCRELTKVHEEVRRGSAADLARHYGESPARGEVVLVLGAAEPGSAQAGDALAAVRELQQAGARPRAAASAVARLTGLSANDLYRSLTDGSTRQ